MYFVCKSINESKEKIKKYEELYIKTKDLIRLITKNSGDYDYDKKYVKIKFNWDNELPLNKTIEKSTKIIVFRAIFLEINKYYPQVFLDECLYELWKCIKRNWY